MKLSSVLLNLGTSALTSLNPLVGAGVVSLVNLFMGNDEKINIDSTADTVLTRIGLLADTDKQRLLTHDVDLEIQLSQERMNASDNTVTITKLLNNNSTANDIVLQAAKTVQRAITMYGVLLLGIALCQLYSLVSGDEFSIERIRAIKEVIPAWETIATMLGVPTIIIYKFLGVQSQDNRTLTNGLNGFKTKTTSESLKSLVTHIRTKK